MMKNGMTLKEFLTKGNHDGFRLALGYYAMLKHGLMGMFPIIESESKEMVITTDPGLLKRVLETLSPRRFVIGTQLLYINPESGTAYSILGTDEQALEKATQFQTLTQARFDQLRIMGDKIPFRWAPGLVSNGMSDEEFKEALRATLDKIDKIQHDGDRPMHCAMPMKPAGRPGRFVCEECGHFVGDR